MHLPPTAALASVGQPCDTLVGIVGQGDDRRGWQLLENRSDRRHARGERDCRATFEAADDLFQGLPARRAVVARVSAALSSTKFDAGYGGTFSGEPGRLSRPAETSHDSTEPGSPGLCPVTFFDVIARF